MKLSKVLALVLALVMVFAFAACAKAPATTTDTPKDTQQTADQPADEPASEPASEAPAAPEGAPEMNDVSDKITEWNGEFSFKVNDKELKNADLADLTKWKVKELETVNSKGVVEAHDYAGYAIKDVLKAAGVDNATKITVVCDDTYEIEYTITDENAPYTLIAIEKDKKLASAGVFFAPCLEETASNYAKNVIEIKTAD